MIDMTTEKKTWVKCPGCSKFLLAEWDMCKACGWTKEGVVSEPVLVKKLSQDTSIARSVALKCAVETQISADNILLLAEKFEKWLTR